MWANFVLKIGSQKSAELRAHFAQVTLVGKIVQYCFFFIRYVLTLTNAIATLVGLVLTVRFSRPFQQKPQPPPPPAALVTQVTQILNRTRKRPPTVRQILYYYLRPFTIVLLSKVTKSRFQKRFIKIAFQTILR